jgi:Homeodomain
MDPVSLFSLPDILPPVDPLSEQMAFNARSQKDLPDHSLLRSHSEVAFTEDAHQHSQIQQRPQQHPHPQPRLLHSLLSTEAFVSEQQVESRYSDNIANHGTCCTEDVLESIEASNDERKCFDYYKSGDTGEKAVGGAAVRNRFYWCAMRSDKRQEVCGTSVDINEYYMKCQANGISGVLSRDNHALTCSDIVDRHASGACRVLLGPREEYKGCIITKSSADNISVGNGDSHGHMDINFSETKLWAAAITEHPSRPYKQRHVEYSHVVARAPKWIVSSFQRNILLVEFDALPYPALLAKSQIALRIGASVTQVSKWFQHHRESLGRVNQFKLRFSRVKKSASDLRILKGMLTFYNIPFSVRRQTSSDPRISFENYEAYYLRERYPTADGIAKLAGLLESVSAKQIRVWFKHRRKQHFSLKNQTLSWSFPNNDRPQPEEVEADQRVTIQRDNETTLSKNCEIGNSDVKRCLVNRSRFTFVGLEELCSWGIPALFHHQSEEMDGHCFMHNQPQRICVQQKHSHQTTHQQIQDQHAQLLSLHQYARLDQYEMQLVHPTLIRR